MGFEGCRNLSKIQLKSPAYLLKQHSAIERPEGANNQNRLPVAFRFSQPTDPKTL